MKIYTQTGDEGKTSLLSGERVSKTHVRIEAYGHVDELNSVIGALTAALAPGSEDIGAALEQIQSDLLHAGAWLSATPLSDSLERLTSIGPDRTRRIEALIDAMDQELPTLRSFILPGGSPPAAWAHLARTVCRRAERKIMEVIEEERRRGLAADGLQGLLAFLNRLSDYFFVLARFLNRRAGASENIWRA